MGIWKDKARREWVYQFQFQGRGYGARGFQTRREAESAREARRKEILESSKQTPQGMAFREAASAYLDYSERKHATATYKYKKTNFKEFLDLTGDIPIAEINPTHITAYLLTLKSNAVYNARRKDLAACFAWAIKTYRLPIENPCSAVDKMPHAPKKKRIPTPAEVSAMLLAASPGDEQDILMCCIHLMGRIDEILRLTWVDINFEKRVATLWTRKRRNGELQPDDMPINDDLYQILWSRWEGKESDKWVFYNEDTKDRYYHRPKMMAGICKRAGIDPIGMTKRKIGRGKKKGQYKDVPVYYGFHALRHFVPSHLMDQKKTSLKTLQMLLRHRNAKTTEIYVHSIDESVRDAMTGIEGKFTPKTDDPLQEPLQKNEKGVTGKG